MPDSVPQLHPHGFGALYQASMLGAKAIHTNMHEHEVLLWYAKELISDDNKFVVFESRNGAVHACAWINNEAENDRLAWTSQEQSEIEKNTPEVYSLLKRFRNAIFLRKQHVAAVN